MSNLDNAKNVVSTETVAAKRARKAKTVAPAPKAALASNATTGAVAPKTVAKSAQGPAATKKGASAKPVAKPAEKPAAKPAVPAAREVDGISLSPRQAKVYDFWVQEKKGVVTRPDVASLLFGKENWQRTGEAGAALFGLAKKLGRKIKLDKPGRIQTYTLLPKEEPKPAAKQPTAQALRVAVAKRTAKAK